MLTRNKYSKPVTQTGNNVLKSFFLSMNALCKCHKMRIYFIHNQNKHAMENGLRSHRHL